MSSRFTPPPPWTLRCPWCEFRLLVFARGQRGDDQGSGVEAAERMAEHAERVHGRTWEEVVACLH